MTTVDPYLERSVRARWTTEDRLGRRSALVPTQGAGTLAWDRTKVVRPWAPWLRLALEWVLVVGAIAAVNVWFGSTHAVAGAAALGTVFWLPGEYDSLIWLAVAAGVLTAAAAVITTEVLTPFLTVYGVITGFVAGWFGTGVVAGSVRAFSRSFNSSNENA